jgi:hypothetical protein
MAGPPGTQRLFHHKEHKEHKDEVLHPGSVENRGERKVHPQSRQELFTTKDTKSTKVERCISRLAEIREEQRARRKAAKSAKKGLSA